MAEFRHLRAIVSSGESGGAAAHELKAARPRDQFFGIVEAGAAIRAFAQRGIASLGVTRYLPRDTAQIAFPNGVADADVHGWRVSLQVIRSREISAKGSQ